VFRGAHVFYRSDGPPKKAARQEPGSRHARGRVLYGLRVGREGGRTSDGTTGRDRLRCLGSLHHRPSAHVDFVDFDPLVNLITTLFHAGTRSVAALSLLPSCIANISALWANFKPIFDPPCLQFDNV